jgi:hypothetical protein
MSIVVRAEWDPEARVFVASSDDVPGLVAEGESPPALMDKLLVLVPELLDLNRSARGRHDEAMREIPMYVMRQQVSKIRVHA